MADSLVIIASEAAIEYNHQRLLTIPHTDKTEKRVSIISGWIMTELTKKFGWTISRTDEKKAVFPSNVSCANRKKTTRVRIEIIKEKECPTIWLSPAMLNTTALQKVKSKGWPRDKVGVRQDGKRPICPVSIMLKAPGPYTPSSSHWKGSKRSFNFIRTKKIKARKNRNSKGYFFNTFTVVFSYLTGNMISVSNFAGSFTVIGSFA
jgi:hypothetical protein